MNIALVLQHKLLLGIHRFMHGTPTATRLSMACQAQRPAQRPLASRCTVASGNEPATATRQVSARVMPLRVLRIVETDAPRSSTGRMVISGRMADVCAELDRLVEREAALQMLH